MRARTFSPLGRDSSTSSPPVAGPRSPSSPARPASSHIPSARRPSRLSISSLAKAAALTSASLLFSPAFAEAYQQQQQQHVFSLESSSSSSPPSSSVLPGTQLHGRFLHLTDLHPDGYYKYGSAVASACHSNKPKKKKKEGKLRAGWWGTGVSECDSPPRLVEATLDWAAENWLPKDPTCNSQGSLSNSSSSSSSSAQPCHVAPGQGIDFIIWTGDSARHDIDSHFPRTRQEIYEYNRWAVRLMEQRFPGIPVVPSIGNNDIFPHNIMFPGPNDVTRAYTNVWSSHIPESEFHVFQQGGYFAKEIIQDDLAVFSLNTLYWYDSNKAVDGCPRKKKDPGSAQLDWLEAQLGQRRKRGMQVHLIGHVPPTAGNYYKRCYERYTDIVLRYQDTIIGQWFGHMNYDALFLQEDPSAQDFAPVVDDGEGGSEEPETWSRDDIGVSAISNDLRSDYRTLPGPGRTDLDMYHMFWVAPSVIPTFWPSARVWTYNTTRSAKYFPSGAENAEEEAATSIAAWYSDEDEDEDEALESSEAFDVEAHLGPIHTTERKHRRPKHGGKRKHKKHRKLPRHASADAPVRRNTYLSLLGYSQWVLDIDAANAAHERAKKKGRELEEEEASDVEAEASRGEKLDYFLEYATYEASVLWGEFLAPSPSSHVQEDEDKAGSGPGRGEQHVPVPKAMLSRELKRLGVDPPSLLSSSLSQTDLHNAINAIHAIDDDDDDDAIDDEVADALRLPKSLKRLTEYALPSVTLEPVMDLARRLAVSKGLWKRYVRRIFSSSGVTEG